MHLSVLTHTRGRHGQACLFETRLGKTHPPCCLRESSAAWHVPVATRRPFGATGCVAPPGAFRARWLSCCSRAGRMCDEGMLRSRAFHPQCHGDEGQSSISRLLSTHARSVILCGVAGLVAAGLRVTDSTVKAE